MLLISVSGLFIGDYRSGLGIFLHGLAIWTIISICLGIYFARHRNIQAHKGFMLGSYFGLLGALIGVISVPTRRVPAYFHAYPLLMTLIAIGIFAASGFVVTLFSRFTISTHPK
ncbi:MAG: putative integral rane protein [Candidatus Saccharibacteria bacterium]|nr:putative integral rane protein [Candidatus Saccharibacteria bacterium]